MLAVGLMLVCYCVSAPTVGGLKTAGVLLLPLFGNVKFIQIFPGYLGVLKDLVALRYYRFIPIIVVSAAGEEVSSVLRGFSVLLFNQSMENMRRGDVLTFYS